MTTDLIKRACDYLDTVQPPFPFEMFRLANEMVNEIDRLTRALNHESVCRDKAVQDRTRAERQRDDFASRALIALAGAHICTPAEGFVHAPHTLPRCIEDLAQERDDALAEIEIHKKIFLDVCAEAAALREVLTDIASSTKWGEDTAIKREISRLQSMARDVLAMPLPGAQLLEELKRLRAVADAARRYNSDDYGTAYEGQQDIRRCLAALEAKP